MIGLHSVPQQAICCRVIKKISFIRPIAANGDGSKRTHGLFHWRHEVNSLILREIL